MITKGMIVVAVAFMFALTVGILTAESGMTCYFRSTAGGIELAPGCVTSGSERGCLPSAPDMPAVSSDQALTLRRPTSRCTSSFSAPRPPAPPCTRSPASSHRFVSCGLKAAASCASNRPIRGSRRPSSRPGGSRYCRRRNEASASHHVPAGGSPIPAARVIRSCLRSRARPARLSFIRRAPAEWGTIAPPGSTSDCACTVSSNCAWLTARSCPKSSPAIRTPRLSQLRKKART